jgi:hypothetical protein
MLLKLASIAIVLVSSFSMADTSRTLSFAFPLLLVAVSDLIGYGQCSQTKLQRTLSGLLAMNMLTPAAVVFLVPIEIIHKPLQWATPILPLPVNIWHWMHTSLTTHP